MTRWNLLGLLLTLVLFPAREAYAGLTTVRICLEFDTAWIDAGTGDFWASNDDRWARGVFLFVENPTLPNPNANQQFNGFIDDRSGCQNLTLDDTLKYQVSAISRANVNGVEINVFDTAASGAYRGWVFFPGASYDPLVDGDVTVDIPIDNYSRQLAIATWSFNRNNYALAPSDTINFEAENGACCSGFRPNDEIIDMGGIVSRYDVARELGAMVAFRRDLDQSPEVDSTASTDNCYADNGLGYAHIKRYHSLAAALGFEDYFAAWLWNSRTQSDCQMWRSFTSDFDLNFSTDNLDGVSSCEFKPVPALASYVDDRDLLEDLVNGADPSACSGTLQNRGMAYDWTRFWWDMTTDGNVPAGAIMDIWDSTNSYSWDEGENTPTTADDPQQRVRAAADFEGYLTEFLTHDNNGQDH